MDTDMEMEVEGELAFEAREVDLEYEFDAPTFFEFTREESLPEARVAESWFLTAPCYPPSPFVAKLVRLEEGSSEDGGGGEPGDPAGLTASRMDVFDREDAEGMYRRILSNLQSNNTQIPCQPPRVAEGQTIFNHLPTETKVRSTIKPKACRSSTLMKPTASILAKQNRPPLRYPNPLFRQEKPISNSIGVEGQATKRQKLEGGHLLKVGEAKSQTDFLHKAPKRDVNSDKTSVIPKMRLTIPREPDFETAHRAQRIRPKSATESNHVEVVERRFRARPLNRKILEAPSLPLPKRSTPKLPEFQEFHLKTSERAMHHPSSNSSSMPLQSTFGKVSNDLGKPGNLTLAENGIRESKRPNMVETPRQDGCGGTFAFKARPFNRKIFLSKGNIGGFQNTKLDVMMPTEFRFQTDKRAQHNPPVELFSKLCLTAEVEPNNGSKMPFSRPSSVSLKGSKENRAYPFQTGRKMTGPAKDAPSPIYSVKQNPCGSDGCMKEVGNHINLRSFGIG